MKLPLRATAIALMSSLLAAPAAALFKVVAPDGTVTYTDQPPAAGQGREMAVERRSSPAEDNTAPLPLPLREPSSRFPVTLYTINNCPPCDRGRALLQQRGVPFRELRSETEADRTAWLRIVGSLDAPALTIGRQVLRGFSADDWHGYLDTAGYPGEAKLPANYKPPPVAPLAARRPAAPAPAPARNEADGEAAAPPAVALPASGIRF